ncbi:MAG: hypothetical protein JRG73_18405 [Deltaproteobacteria bacterium]|nr:hypothetical protein [Deltaproteobacteria bacterium]MBW2308899.1 hypothetical protein [Deltaproteobacteria bacterium]
MLIAAIIAAIAATLSIIIGTMNFYRSYRRENPDIALGFNGGDKITDRLEKTKK